MPDISMSDVQEHNTRDSAWTVIDDKVYDLTNFLAEHPGGEEVLLERAGKDATQAFKDVNHSEDAQELKEKYFVGNLHKPRESIASNNASTSTPIISDQPQGQNFKFEFCPLKALVGVSIGVLTIGLFKGFLKR
ncbi:Cytochrome b5 [Cichlidogyrus casuarinus]|uniref:Cytochrome b5 n=1 Tax=Cichlidogyrus casuarinus TaxID=1844966 RepID=A0ABD2PWP9_9PLAT